MALAGNDGPMQQRFLKSSGTGTVSRLDEMPDRADLHGWLWIDIETDGAEGLDLDGISAELELDALAVRDAFEDDDLPKVDDFGSHLLVVLHGLRDDTVETYEVDCFLTSNRLVTVHGSPSPSIEALWDRFVQTPDLGNCSIDIVLAQLADILTRRLHHVIEVFNDGIDELITMALEADPQLLGELMAVRSDVSGIRRAVSPQREALDELRTSPSSLVSDSGRRRFSDVFDVAERTAQGLENARTELAETLDAYRGAEARKATDVTKVLTIYAAIMLPLGLVVGFFGMNFVDLPGLKTTWGWIAVSVFMVAIAIGSLIVFASVGWIRRPSARQATTTLGRGLIEAARAPVHIGAAAFVASTKPLRATAARVKRDGPDS